VNVKGSALRARLQYAADKGEEASRLLLDHLSPSTRTLCETGLLVNGWYPFSAFVELNTALDRLFGQGDLSLCYEIGRYACDVNLKTLYKIFFRIGSVQFIVRRAAAAWRVNYDDGQMRVLAETNDWVHLRVTGVPAPHRAHCLSVKGWMVRAVELSGAQVIGLDERCRTLGDPECEFEFRWKKR
jgi:hypothetical protein